MDFTLVFFVVVLNLLIFRLVTGSQKLVPSVFRRFSTISFICSLPLSVRASNFSAMLGGNTTHVAKFTSSPVSLAKGCVIAPDVKQASDLQTWYSSLVTLFAEASL